MLSIGFLLPPSMPISHSFTAPQEVLDEEIWPQTPSCPSGMSFLHHYYVLPCFSPHNLVRTLAIHRTSWNWCLSVQTQGIMFFLFSLSLTFFCSICHYWPFIFTLEMFSSFVLLSGFSWFCFHISSHSTLLIFSAISHSLPILLVNILRRILCRHIFWIYAPFFFFWSVTNIHWIPPIVPDSLGIQTQILFFKTTQSNGDRLQAKSGGTGHLNDTVMEILGYFSFLPAIENVTQQLFHLNPSSELTSCLHFLDNSLGLWLYHLSRFSHLPPRYIVARHQLRAGMVWLILQWNESSVSSVSNEGFSFLWV